MRTPKSSTPKSRAATKRQTNRKRTEQNESSSNSEFDEEVCDTSLMGSVDEVDSLYSSPGKDVSATPSPRPSSDQKNRQLYARKPLHGSPSVTPPRVNRSMQEPPLSNSSQNASSRIYPDLEGLFSDSGDKSPKKKLFEYEAKPCTPVKSNQLYYIGFAVIVLIVAIIAFNPLAHSNIGNGKSQTNQVDELLIELKKMKALFPSQDTRFWQTVSAATKRIIYDTVPIQPAVILIGSTQATSKEADCLARYISKLVTKIYDAKSPIFIDVPTEYASLKPEAAKIKMDDAFRSAFGNGAKSVVVTGLEEMHGDTAMLLHAFCDNDNAPYTKVEILFTVHLGNIDLSDAREAATKVEDHLSAIWQRHINYDDVNALLSRVANNIIIARKEGTNVMNDLC